MLNLPPAPECLTGPVKAWSEDVRMPTWEPMEAERNPMFLEKRVYQGSSGRVYPLPFIDRIADKPVDKAWQAIHLENEYLRVMILPELGGRIHLARDKTNNYDFVYRQDVIKPALVGLAGPWVSGGIEFNWPQHHRPGTYLPTDVHIEEESDGSRTVWLSAHDPQTRMKGMHGVRLRPGNSCVELRVRLHNATPLTQTFLWWANVAAEVNESYQSFFPEDVHSVADHAKRAMSSFPLCHEKYYGLDYAARARDGVPEAEQPRQFRADHSDHSYPPNDLSWYANIAVPTSYMCLGSKDDFFGGYDHKAAAGIVHVADHHIAPGKKQWTWGNHEFGYAWDRLLTVPDEHGVYRPYIELMAGAYTDNQPDFSFMAPGETRVFSQYWYPIRQIGTVHQANADSAVSLRLADNKAQIGVVVTSSVPGAVVALKHGDNELGKWELDLSPAQPFLVERTVPAACDRNSLSLRVSRSSGQTLIEYRPHASEIVEEPVLASEPPAPQAVVNNDELYLIGLHLEQYRHATRSPDIYWREALRRDPLDARCNTATGVWHLRRGEFVSAEDHLRRALQRLTHRNPNPADGEALYNLGVCLRHLSRDDEAYGYFYKATWNAGWRSPGYLALAEISGCRNEWALARQHLELALRHDSDNLWARHLQVLVLRQLGQEPEAENLLQETLRLDPLDPTGLWLAGQTIGGDTQTRIDLSINLARAGFTDFATDILRNSIEAADPGTLPLLHYYVAHYASSRHQNEAAALHQTRAAAATKDYCFPSRIEDFVALESALKNNPRDASAHYLIGNLLYDKRCYQAAVAHWEKAATLQGTYPTVWRNLGIARFNILGDAAAAKDAYERAFAANPSDARVLYERDQLWKRIGILPAARLIEFENHLPLVHRRDDLCVELCSLYNHAGNSEKALDLLLARRFQPWEGGEGLVLGQYVRTRLALGRQALERGAGDEAIKQFTAALHTPENLGEARHLLANPSEILYWLGKAQQAIGMMSEATATWEKAASFKGDFQLMSVRAYSELSYFSALSLQAMGQDEEAKSLLAAIDAYAEELLTLPAKIDYFATSLPTMLLFDEDLQQRQRTSALLMKAQAARGLGHFHMAQTHLNAALEMDPNHAMAVDLGSELNAPAVSADELAGVN